jgi:hypothetical protein
LDPNQFHRSVGLTRHRFHDYGAGTEGPPTELQANLNRLHAEQQGELAESKAEHT